MTVIRSAVFNLLFFLTLAIFLVFGTPLLLFDRKYVFAFWKCLSISLDFLTQTIAGIKYKIHNPQNILKTPAIYAIRHESIWETLILIQKFHCPIFVLKEELLKIPFFGLFSKKAGTIGVNRKNGARSLLKATMLVNDSIKEKHPIIIFPEGTRVSTGKYIEIKRGIALFYKKNNCPVVPVIHNSGKYWARRGFLKTSGEISVNFLDPIQPGLSQEEFLEKLNEIFRTEIEKLAKT